jgi:CRP/FNR family transcriptional regulator, cyclic AMP receptor protein
MDKKTELLRRVPLFSRMNGRSLEQVGRLSDEVDLPAGRELMREGDPGREFYLILEGTVRVERAGRTINSLGPGDFLGEIALLDGGPRSATATTESAARLLVLGRREFHSLVDDFPEVRTSVLEALAHRVRHLEPDSPN